MRLDKFHLWQVLLGVALLAGCEARRVRVQPVEDDDIQYYSPEEQDGSGRAVVLVSSDDYNGLYGQQSLSRNAQDNYIPPSRGATTRGGPSYKDARVSQKESNKSPPVQTIRNYNKVNDDGSFTFGYEAADGSFKEETRGTDCVVRGKYGYVDPDGNKREFTYVSGNPCDPNAPKEEDSQERVEEESNEPENVPANYPTRPIRPIRPLPSTVPVTPRPAVTVYQNTYAQDEEQEDSEIEQPEPEQVLRAQHIQQQRHRPVPVRPTYIPEERPTILQQRPRVIPTTTPSPITYQTNTRPITLTPRPLTATPATIRTQAPIRTHPPPTTYRPQLLQVAVTPRPALLYTKPQITAPQRTTHYPTTTQAPITRVSPSRPTSSAALDFASEFHRFTQDNQIISSTPSPVLRTTKPASSRTTTQLDSSPVYSSELVYDPSSGQYKTQLYQTLPQTDGDFTLNHRIQPYVAQPQPQLVNFRQLQQQSPLYRGAVAAAAAPTPASTTRPAQALYQQQQAELQLHNSQQLFAQQQRARAQQQRQQQQQTQPQAQPQQFYYIQPQTGIASGQIEAFLRGHNIQF